MRNIRKSKPGQRWKSFLFGLASLGLVALITYQLQIIPFWVSFIDSSSLIKIISYPFLACLIVLFLGLAFRLSLWLKYRPETLKTVEPVDFPPVSVIMPAYNEEKWIGRAVESILASDYPQDKLELICINDGSTDSTLSVLENLRRRDPRRIKVISFDQNRGKKEALFRGIKEASGQIIITTDADSQLQRRAIKNLILPLLVDERVGAVAGKVAVLNENKNLMTRMLAIRYALAFDFGRAYQSVYGGVLCCPGALSAFRKRILLKVIHGWKRQKFLKAACQHGEDRSLTNLILKKGYLVKYQSNAVVNTRVPEKMSEANRMYLRWTRSAVRESWFFARFILLRGRRKYYLLPAIDFFFQSMLHPLHLTALALLTCSIFIRPDFFFNQLIFLIVLAMALNLNNYRVQKNIKWLYYGVLQGLFAFFFQWWLVPYSIITVRDQNWLTK
ncbi:MAG TPA: glycosyltransferase [Candidatus Saccharicenans sp.]|nr:glycosyltransferase [Candidatus Saccharicenans sp.]HOT69551.1 glycosyltransferase [Candidatus Saccharicenans sp.]HQE65004.1 glycosyltransferase [Candidatus Saccharicenans sp.]HQI22987.1 glycosyltransferase [Candidatus Saccharicenans sp.]